MSQDLYAKKSILQMARGAIQERADYEITKILENILDPNTSATAARKLTITLTLKPDDTRRTSPWAWWPRARFPPQTPSPLPCSWPTRTPSWRWCRRSPGSWIWMGRKRPRPLSSK